LLSLGARLPLRAEIKQKNIYFFKFCESFKHAHLGKELDLMYHTAATANTFKADIMFI